VTDTSSTVSRLLALVPYVLSRGSASITETAAEFGVDAGQLRKELEMLWLCGRSSGPEDLIDLLFDGDTVSVIYDGGLSRPLKLTSTEAMTLAVALRTLDTPGPAARALAKIETAAGQHLDTSGVDIRLTEEQRWLALTRQAVTDQRAIRMSYYTASRDATSERVIDPIQLFTADSVTYLEAWCRLAQAIRIFRLDRITDAVMLDERAQVPAEVSPSDLSSGVYRPAPEHLLVELVLKPGWTWVADYYPTESTDSEADPMRISLRVPDPAWVSALVRRSGGGVSVLAPDWLARTVADDARAALDAYHQ
jgi:proteasome accessory factor C